MIDQRNESLRAAIFTLAIDLVPPIIRSELLSDVELRRQFGIRTDAVVTLADSEVRFKRSKLFSAARSAASAPGEPKGVYDETGKAWKVTALSGDGAADLVIRAGAQVFHVGHLLLLTKNKNLRKAFFARQAEDLNLPREREKRWLRFINRRPLSEDELTQLMTDVAQSPVAVNGRISKHWARGGISLKDMVPRSVNYYGSRLSAGWRQRNVKEYAEEVAREHIRKLLAWRVSDGLRFALLMGSHPLISLEIGKQTITTAEFNSLANWAQTSDVMAQGVTLELALQRPRDRAKVGANVQLLAERFVHHGEGEAIQPVPITIDSFCHGLRRIGQDARSGIKLPFWRRLAAMAQAAVIARCVLSTRADLSGVVKWMASARMGEYIVQCCADLRTEPRWLPDFGLPEQLKNEIAGRVLLVALGHEAAAKKLGIRDVLADEKPDSLKSQLNLLFTQLPGPLEGNVEPLAEVPAKAAAQLRNDLSVALPSVSSFGRVANSALFYRLPDDIPRLAAEAIRRAQYRLESDGDREALRSCLAALATVAAVSRSAALADELLITIRTYRRLKPADMDILAAFRIGMTACACRPDFPDWCKSVGALVSDLGFGQLTRGRSC